LTRFQDWGILSQRVQVAAPTRINLGALHWLQLLPCAIPGWGDRAPAPDPRARSTSSTVPAFITFAVGRQQVGQTAGSGHHALGWPVEREGPPGVPI